MRDTWVWLLHADPQVLQGREDLQLILKPPWGGLMFGAWLSSGAGECHLKTQTSWSPTYFAQMLQNILLHTWLWQIMSVHLTLYIFPLQETFQFLELLLLSFHFFWLKFLSDSVLFLLFFPIWISSSPLQGLKPDSAERMMFLLKALFLTSRGS